MVFFHVIFLNFSAKRYYFIVVFPLNRLCITLLVLHIVNLNHYITHLIEYDAKFWVVLFFTLFFDFDFDYNYWLCMEAHSSDYIYLTWKAANFYRLFLLCFDFVYVLNYWFFQNFLNNNGFDFLQQFNSIIIHCLTNHNHIFIVWLLSFVFIYFYKKTFFS